MCPSNVRLRIPVVSEIREFRVSNLTGAATSTEVDCREECDYLALSVEQCQDFAGTAIPANIAKRPSERVLEPVEGRRAGHPRSCQRAKGEMLALPVI